nr:hypothetical protein [Acidovorax sp.]
MFVADLPLATVIGVTLVSSKRCSIPSEHTRADCLSSAALLKLIVGMSVAGRIAMKASLLL